MFNELFTALPSAIDIVLSWESIFWIVAGTLLGIIVGALPGVGSALGTSLVLPFTMYMDPIFALLFIISLYDGAMYGGSIPAILMNIPGDSSAAASTLEGHPMAKKGKSITALTISGVSSSMGGLIGDTIAIFGSVLMLPFMLMFGTPEYLLIGVFGLTLICLVSSVDFYKALLSAVLGLSITLIGMAPSGNGELRYTFNVLELYDGIALLPILLGLFGVVTMANLYSKKSDQISQTKLAGGSRMEGIKQTFKYWKTLIKSSVIGFIVGAIPGTGATIATFVAYGESARNGKNDKTKFGTGNPRGLVATESSNNSCVDGAIIPTLMFGIPGSLTMAIILVAMLLHGLRPGVSMFEGEGYIITIAMFLGLIISEVVITVVGLTSVRGLSKLTTINKHYIIPVVLILAVVGIFSVSFNWFDVGVMIGASFIGYIMLKFGFPVVPAITGIVLGTIVEENLLRTIQLSDGNLMYILERPVSLVLLVMIVGVVVAPMFRWLKK